MKKLYLHIGSYKTGTSSIQNTFHKNRGPLAQQDFFYPGNDINHHKFFFATDSAEKDCPRQFKNIDKQRLEKIIGNYFSILEKDFQSHHQQQIISTEYLFISNEEYIHNVIEYLNNFFSDVTVFVFIRDPAEYYRSVQQQMIKARSYITSPGSFHYEFKDVIEAWGQFCDVEVIKYEKEKNSCELLCNKIGVVFESLSQSNHRTNASLSVEQMALLEKIQRQIYPGNEDQFKPHLGVIHNISSEFTNKPRLKKKIAQEIKSKHKNDLVWLKDHFSIDFTKGMDSLEERSANKTGITKKKATVRDVYQVNEKTAERFEAACMDLLLKEFTKTAPSRF